jgi:hypothetical protein
MIARIFTDGNIDMNSSKERSNQTLAATPFSARAKQLLIGLANLPDEIAPGLRYLKKQFPFVLEDLPPRSVRTETRFSEGENFPIDLVPNTEEEKYEFLILPLRDTLRAIWRAPDTYTKKWGIFRLCQDFFLRGDPALISPSISSDGDSSLRVRPPTRTERRLTEFSELIDQVRYCDGSECLAPYFIGRRNQKYCSPPCAAESQRQYKRKWWAENVSQWRASSAKRETEDKEKR